MKTLSLTLTAFLITLFSYTQNIEGKWQSKENEKMGFVFLDDGTAKIIDFENPDIKVLKNITVKYQVVKTDNLNFLVMSYYLGDIKKGEKKWTFRIENDTLYMKENDITAKNTAQSALTINEEEYIRIK